MKVRYPDGVPLDDLDIGSKYEFELRNQSVVVGSFLQLLLQRGMPPRIGVMPDGKASQVVLRLPAIKEIRVAGVDLDGGDGSGNTDGEEGECC